MFLTQLIRDTPTSFALGILRNCHEALWILGRDKNALGNWVISDAAEKLPQKCEQKDELLSGNRKTSHDFLGDQLIEKIKEDTYDLSYTLHMVDVCVCT